MSERCRRTACRQAELADHAPSRNRAWAHPVLIAFIEQLAQKLPSEAGWAGLLVGDIAQPRGGPMPTGHGYTIGLDVDIWLTPMPNRRLSPAERDSISATNVVAADRMDIDSTVWTLQHRLLLEAVAREPLVERVFVNAIIKRALCRPSHVHNDVFLQPPDQLLIRPAR
jgi:penicillin-insensitive murein endopeptidase